MPHFLQHRRTPAVVVLLAVLSLGAVTLAWMPAGREVACLAAPAGPAGTRAVADLEIAIASDRATAADWYTYAEVLWSRRAYADSARACREVLAREPYHRDARFRRGLALAAAGAADELYSYLQNLSWSEPKLAVDLFARTEIRPYLGDARLRALRREAQSQAMD